MIFNRLFHVLDFREYESVYNTENGSYGKAITTQIEEGHVRHY